MIFAVVGSPSSEGCVVCEGLSDTCGFLLGKVPGLAVTFAVAFGLAVTFATAFGLDVTFAFFFALTTTLQVYFFLPILATILAVPFFFALTTPFLVTVAIFFFEEDHFTFFLVPFTFNLAFLPTVNTSFFLFSLTFALASVCCPGTNTDVITNAPASTRLIHFFLSFFMLFPHSFLCPPDCQFLHSPQAQH